MQIEFLNIMLGVGLGFMFTLTLQALMKKWRKGKEKPKENIVCPRCGSQKISKLDNEEGKVFCEKCKLVFDEEPAPAVRKTAKKKK